MKCSLVLVRPVVWSFCLSTWLGIVAGAGDVSANPGPPAPFVLLHVHPWDDGFCQQPPMQSCEQIVQHTTEVGDLEFDLYLATFVGHVSELTNAEIRFLKPPSWTLVGFFSCGLSQDSVASYADSIDVSLRWPTPLALGQSLDEPPVLLGRLRLQVDGHGALQTTRSMLNGDRWTWEGNAEAGVTCSFEDQPCGWPYSPCGVSFGVHELSARVTSGETVQLMAPVNNQRFREVCPSRFVVDVPWLSVELLPAPGAPRPEDDDRQAVLLLTIDATGLSPGTLQGQVEALTELTTDCLDVALQVEARAPVELQSWGRIKARYRG